MLTHDIVRYDLLQARKLPDGEERDGNLADLLATAMVDARGHDGAATASVLSDRYGFTADELAHYGNTARDEATRRWNTMSREPEQA
jgi:hypothetical protein